MADEFDSALTGLKQLFVDLDGDGKPDVAVPMQTEPRGTPGAEMRSFNPPPGMVVESAINEHLPRSAAEQVNNLFQMSPMGSATQMMDSGRSAVESGRRGDWTQTLKDIGMVGLAGAGAYAGGSLAASGVRNLLTRRAESAGIAERSRIPQIEQSYQPRSGLPPFAAERAEVLGPWGPKPSAETPEWINATRHRRNMLMDAESNPYSTMRNEKGQFVPKTQELTARRNEVGQPLADRQSAERRGGREVYSRDAGPNSEHLVNLLRAEQEASRAELQAAKTGIQEQKWRADFLRSVADRLRKEAQDAQPQNFLTKR